MADISKIKLPDGNTYDIKDAVARSQSGGTKAVDLLQLNFVGTMSGATFTWTSATFDGATYTTRVTLRTALNNYKTAHGLSAFNVYVTFNGDTVTSTASYIRVKDSSTTYYWQMNNTNATSGITETYNTASTIGTSNVTFTALEPQQINILKFSNTDFDLSGDIAKLNPLAVKSLLDPSDFDTRGSLVTALASRVYTNGDASIKIYGTDDGNGYFKVSYALINGSKCETWTQVHDTLVAYKNAHTNPTLRVSFYDTTGTETTPSVTSNYAYAYFDNDTTTYLKCQMTSYGSRNLRYTSVSNKTVTLDYNSSFTPDNIYVFNKDYYVNGRILHANYNGTTGFSIVEDYYQKGDIVICSGSGNPNHFDLTLNSNLSFHVESSLGAGSISILSVPYTSFVGIVASVSRTIYGEPLSASINITPTSLFIGTPNDARNPFSSANPTSPATEYYTNIIKHRKPCVLVDDGTSLLPAVKDSSDATLTPSSHRVVRTLDGKMYFILEFSSNVTIKKIVPNTVSANTKIYNGIWGYNATSGLEHISPLIMTEGQYAPTYTPAITGTISSKYWILIGE